MLKTLQFLSLFFALFLFARPALAGGGPIALHADPIPPLNQSRSFIVSAVISTKESCSNFNPTFKFTDSANGDTITPYTPPDNGRYIERHYYDGGWFPFCTTYVRATSEEKRERRISVNVVVNGRMEQREIPLNFALDTPDYRGQRAEVDIKGEKYLGGIKREVYLHWNRVPGTAKYSVFIKEPSDEAKAGRPEVTTADNSATIIVNAFLPFWISVNNCTETEPCTEEKPYTYGRLLDKLRNVQPPKEVSYSESTSAISYSIPTAPPVVDVTIEPPSQGVFLTTPLVSNQIAEPTTPAQVEELNQKILDLQKKLENSEKKQSYLEQRLETLMVFLKDLFPFFK